MQIFCEIDLCRRAEIGDNKPIFYVSRLRESLLRVEGTTSVWRRGIERCLFERASLRTIQTTMETKVCRYFFAYRTVTNETTFFYQTKQTKKKEGPCLAFESTPSNAISRTAAEVYAASQMDSLFVILRNPIDRLVSAFNMETERGKRYYFLKKLTRLFTLFFYCCCCFV